LDIFLSKKIISDLRLSNNSIGAYIALKKIHYSLEKSNYYISLNMMLYELFGNNNYNRSDYKHIADGLTGLLKNKLVLITYKITTTEWIVDLSQLVIDTKKDEDNYFTSIREEELYFIMNYAFDSGKRGIDRLSMLRYYINLIGSINYNQGIYIDAIGRQKNNFVGYMSQEYLYKLSGISKNTLIKFNEILESNKIIYVYHHKKNKQEDDGSYKAVTNHYGRYEDKEDIYKFAIQYEKEKGIADRLSDAVSNRHKALANMYRELEKGKGQNYGDDLIREIYNYIHKCNKEIQKEIDSKNSQTYLTDSDLRYIKKLKEKLRDEKVFDKYEFLFKKQMSPDPDDWGEPVSMDVEDNDFSVEDILDMPTESDLVSEPEQLAISKEKSADADTFPMNPVKTITIKKKEQNKEIPLEVKIQQYADDLYEQHGYDTEYEKSIFIVELAEKFPGLEDYEKYYDSAKKLHDLSV
jgi:hypothetical protein